MTSIELAGNWKRSLIVDNPILSAAGGYGHALDAMHRAAPSKRRLTSQGRVGAEEESSSPCEPASVGALVTLPTTLRPRAGSPFPRVVEVPGGVLMRTGAANPGLSNVLREYRRVWSESEIPIIVAFASQGFGEWRTMAAQLDGVAGVAGIELHFNPSFDAVGALRAVRAVTELPILAKLDLDNASEIATDCIAAGANALVIGRAPRGMSIVDKEPWFGRLYGPAAKPFGIRKVAEIAELKLAVPIVGCGGVHTVDDAKEYLMAGANAVEIDSAVWIDPTAAALAAARITA